MKAKHENEFLFYARLDVNENQNCIACYPEMLMGHMTYCLNKLCIYHIDACNLQAYWPNIIEILWMGHKTQEPPPLLF